LFSLYAWFDYLWISSAVIGTVLSFLS